MSGAGGGTGPLSRNEIALEQCACDLLSQSERRRSIRGRMCPRGVSIQKRERNLRVLLVKADVGVALQVEKDESAVGLACVYMAWKKVHMNSEGVFTSSVEVPGRELEQLPPVVSVGCAVRSCAPH